MVSAALADNTIYQSGSMSSRGGGTGVITQSQTNWADVSGDGNYIQQYNSGSAEHNANGGYITQTLSNFVDVDGFANWVWQQNDAYAYTDSSATNAVIEQTGSNLALIGQNYYSDGNTVSQYNHEEADIVGGDTQTINQNLANVGLVDGSYNTLNQNTNWADAYDEGSSKTTINQAQGSAGSIDGKNNYMYQSNLAYATMNYGSESTIYQSQYDTGFQYGYENEMLDWNDASASVWSSDHSSIDQYQSNYGDQYGDWNMLSQYNDADAAMSFGHDDTGDLVGNTIDQDQFSTAVMSAWGFANYVDQNNYANADQTYGGWDETSAQYQSNFADTYDLSNTAIQSNEGYTVMAGDWNDMASQTQTNVALINSYTWNGIADQYNYAYANTDPAWYDDSDVITQTESNMAYITGYWEPVETADQTNLLTAVQEAYSNADISQTASNLATINGP
jgi:hypothetical protein